MSADTREGKPTVTVEISPGELIDKITILQIKLERISDQQKLHNVRTELAVLSDALKRQVPPSSQLDSFTTLLKQVNSRLWEIEDEIRLCERDRNFGDRFVELARSVYKTNDRRAALKREVNELLGSTIVEEKDYQDYA